MDEGKDSFEGWAILELMGHRRLGGFVSEGRLGGAPMVRIDVPGEPAATQLYNPKSVYCCTPTSEETARAVAATCRPAPVQRWELPAAPLRLGACDGDHGEPRCHDPECWLGEEPND